MYSDLDKRIAATMRGLKEKHDLVLNENEVIELMEEIRKELDFGANELEQEIVRLLMALHTIDEDEECHEFYYDVQEKLDELHLQGGFEPIQDKAFSDAISSLLSSGHIQEIITLDSKTNKIVFGIRINFDYKIKLHNVSQVKIAEWKAKKQPQ
jgi:hypothetical protein